MASVTPVGGEVWRFKPNRGRGEFRVVMVTWNRVLLVSPDFEGSLRKSISLRTLRSDYERVS